MYFQNHEVKLTDPIGVSQLQVLCSLKQWLIDCLWCLIICESDYWCSHVTCVCDVQTLNKKEHKGGCESPDTDGDPQFVLTPRTEEKYQKINQDFDIMLQQRNLNNRVSYIHISTRSISVTPQ